MEDAQESFLRSTRVSKEILEPLHTGVAIFDKDAKLVFANSTYRSMYQLEENYAGLDAKKFFLTAAQGIMEVLKTGEPNSCKSVSINGLHGVTYRWPLRGPDGKIAGCMTENISVSSNEGKIGEMRSIITELEASENYSTVFQPRQSGEFGGFESIVGESAAMRLLKEKGRRFARHDEPVLVLGENGTGKDLVARSIHAASTRSSRNFVAVNCAAIPVELMESELFGYEPGAFTGARACGKSGQFELADGGTIFLDEIGEMPLTVQAKLLRVLENHEIKKLGAALPKHVDFRLISATNRNLEQMVRQEKFREDLYYRLNLFDLVVPPLRERLADIPLLAQAMIYNVAGPERGHGIGVSREVLTLFSTYAWRGNVRELRNILTYAVYALKEHEKEIQLFHLPERFCQRARRDSAAMTPELRADANRDRNGLREGRKRAEREAIYAALTKSGGNKAKAARMLGIARSNLYKKIRELGLENTGIEGYGSASSD